MTPERDQTVELLHALGHLYARHSQVKRGLVLLLIAARLAPDDEGVLRTLASRGPNSLAVCTFLDRNSRRIVQVPVDYRCFEIPDRFVVGFGLDYNQLYRNLGFVAAMRIEKP